MKKERLLAVDVFRGFTVMLMTVVNNAGDWSHIFPPLKHAEWNGCTPTDLVFPFFLFIVGVSIVLANPNWDDQPANYFEKVLIRTLRIFTLGLFLNYFSKIHIGGLEGYPLLFVRLAITAVVAYFLLGSQSSKIKLYSAVAILVMLLILAYSGLEDFKNVRIPGVLQRIAIVYFIAALLYRKFGTRSLLTIGLGLLLFYWAIMMLIPVDGFKGWLQPGKNVAARFDALFLKGHMYSETKTWDPEGILSTLPAIGTAIFGILIGKILTSNIDATRKSNNMIYIGLITFVISILWNKVFPINKALWTSSYVLYTGALASLSLALVYLVTDQWKVKFWTKPFIIFGLSPILVFFLSGIIPRVMGMIIIEGQGLQEFIYTNYLSKWFQLPEMASLSWPLIYLFFWYIGLYILYKRNIVVKV